MPTALVVISVPGNSLGVRGTKSAEETETCADRANNPVASLFNQSYVFELRHTTSTVGFSQKALLPSGVQETSSIARYKQ